jgi:ABC-type dipeptide/oligopeptide/nickel transport system permease subunit
MVATTADALVYPARIELWLVASAGFFIVAIALTAGLIAAATRGSTPPAA